jgi:hypothetical protein
MRQETPTPSHECNTCNLRLEMATHARCEQCGILMGPGHIEASTSSLCGTCVCRHRASQAGGEPPIRRSTIGRRGWLSDYAVER